MIHVTTINDIGNQLQKRKSNLLERNETLQCLVAVGKDIKNAKYFVYFDENKYEFENFLGAPDTCFKVFHVLNLEYPKDSIEFWTFIEKYFYNIELSSSKISSNILCLLKELE